MELGASRRNMGGRGVKHMQVDLDHKDIKLILTSNILYPYITPIYPIYYPCIPLPPPNPGPKSPKKHVGLNPKF